MKKDVLKPRKSLADDDRLAGPISELVSKEGFISKALKSLRWRTFISPGGGQKNQQGALSWLGWWKIKQL